MTFTGFDEEDGAPLYDTMESAIERAKMLATWYGKEDTEIQIWIHRKRVPLWFAHLVQDTWLIRLAYKEYKV